MSSGSRRAISSSPAISTRWATRSSAPRSCGVSSIVDVAADPTELQRLERAPLLRAGPVGGADLTQLDLSHWRGPRRPARRSPGPRRRGLGGRGVGGRGVGRLRGHRHGLDRLDRGLLGLGGRVRLRRRLLEVEAQHLLDREAAQLGDVLGRRRPVRPSIVALTRLIGFWVPIDFESTSRTPASSSTARTPPPAITPVPGLAGRRTTWPEPKRPMLRCGIVWPYLGTRIRLLRAFSTAFWIASGTSRALP